MKRATSKDVAKLAGVSQTTVSFVLNNTPGISLSDETRRKVLDAARELNYIPNSFAKGLKTSRSKLLGIFLPTMANPFYQKLMQYIENYTAELGYNVMLCCTYRNAEREKSYLDLCVEHQVDGIIYLFTPNWVKQITRISHNIPVILISEKSEDISINTISLNGFQCGKILTEHLLQLGHKNIAYVMSPVTSVSLTRQMRLQGIKAAVQNAGLGEDALEVITNPVVASDNLEANAGFAAMESILKKKRNTAVIGVNDLVSFGLLSKALNMDGIRIPEDISICGFDNTYLAHMAHPTLTTVEYCTEPLCRLAVDMLLNNNSIDVLKLSGEPKLIIGESTGPAPL
ncbi:LacI family transcriptional regulator [Schaedlerella arabinosiphila]|jgi:LacI family transcriptional regulator|uniref:LacI family transcriptional regulator n=1 Tax=Schaedlerella arabinosiphila TaxID=2044587 RepID=N2A6A4_9FIRM|nr:LacI family DNA-binding transcriptional regulator [Schaedlerella arabinosiphila]KAI4440320.1 HTH-type transcriptional regulator DegA [Schaedlerella arabinosiphila]NBJ02811.1 LacI family transcriptional regulator [Lachnospiraceae bacterium]NDO72561.1 LacI family transcriptional regulator [Schaedlerella arabinosiphila]RRK34999.1 LacI family transcriptional regulator [Schaedlerella arabinosiphila]